MGIDSFVLANIGPAAYSQVNYSFRAHYLHQTHMYRIQSIIHNKIGTVNYVNVRIFFQDPRIALFLV